MNTEHTRRRFLQQMGLLAGSILVPASAHAASKIKTNAHIVIAGAGAAGLTAASKLFKALDEPNVTLIDARKAHYYQPGFTLVGGGIKPANYVTSTTAEYLPKGVNYLQESVAEFDPEGNTVTTQSGQRIQYDYLIVATGMTLNYQDIEGMSPELIGREGIGSIYAGPDAAYATWKAMSQFADTGGQGIFTRPNTEMKCAGAPLKYTFLTEDHAKRRGNRQKTEIHYYAHNQALFSVPIIAEKVRMLFQQRDIHTHYNHVVTAIDPGKKRVWFTTPDGDREVPYDFIHIIPPMSAPDAIKNSPLPWQTGPWHEEGWLEVDRGTLRHQRYPNVFGVGDIAGVPKGKTAASVKWQVPVAINHLVAELSNTSSDDLYTGYTSCPLITQLGRAMLLEFDYDNNLMPSFPGVIAPLEELWVSWVMKTMALKPTYISMLRGYT